MKAGFHGHTDGRLEQRTNGQVRENLVKVTIHLFSLMVKLVQENHIPWLAMVSIRKVSKLQSDSR